MDLSWLPDWLWALIRDPIMPLSMALMTYVWFRGLGTSIAAGELARHRLGTLSAEITRIGKASIPERRRWLLDGDMVAAFKAAGLDYQGRTLRATATSLESGNSAVLLDEANRLFAGPGFAHSMLPRTSATTGPVMVALGAMGTFGGIILGVAGVSNGLTSASGTEFLLAIGDLLDGASLAFCTSFYGLFANVVCGFFHRRLKGRLEKVGKEIHIAILENLNPSTPTDFLNGQFYRMRQASERAFDTMTKLSAQDREQVNKLVRTLSEKEAKLSGLTQLTHAMNGNRRAG